MEQIIIDFESIEWKEPAPGVKFKTIVQDGRQLRLVEFAQNFVEPDWCKKGHIGYQCPSINEKICARSRKAKILTTGIH